MHTGTISPIAVSVASDTCEGAPRRLLAVFKNNHRRVS